MIKSRKKKVILSLETNTIAPNSSKKLIVGLLRPVLCDSKNVNHFY